MKILFVLDNYYPYNGGAEVLFKVLTEGLASKHSVSVLTRSLKGVSSQESINGVSVKRIKTPTFFPRFFFMLFSLPYLLINAKKYDIIHTTTCGSSISAWLTSKIYRIPSVITVLEVIGRDWLKLEIGRFFGYFYILMERILVLLPFDEYVCISRSTQRNLAKVRGKKRSSVVYCSVDYNHWDPKRYKKSVPEIRKKLGLNEKEFLVVFYGRPGESKGVEYFIKSLPKISFLMKNVRFLLILGTDPKKRYEKMKYLLSKYASGKAILHRPVSYSLLPKYVMASDCVVIPSITEGFGFCVAESCALGKPVVASNTTSIPEVVSGKFLLVPPKNSDAIAKAVFMIKQKKYMRTPLRKFTYDKLIDGYELIYEKLKSSK